MCHYIDKNMSRAYNLHWFIVTAYTVTFLNFSYFKTRRTQNEQIKKFETLRYEVQISAMQGLENNKDKEKELQELYASLLAKENVKEYFDAEFKLNVLIADVNKIIGEAIKEVIE